MKEVSDWINGQGKYRKWVLMTLVGVLFLIISWPTAREDTTEETEVMSVAENAPGQEEKLKEVLSKIQGAGQVEVMITYETSVRKILKDDSSVSQSSRNGGSDDITEHSESSEVKTFTGENGDPYVIQEVMPRVEGVLVVADGAHLASVRQEITGAVQALFSLEAHKIRVVKRAS